MAEEKPVIVSGDYYTALEKAAPGRHIRPEGTAGEVHVTERSIPMRSQGESETRLPLGNDVIINNIPTFNRMNHGRLLEKHLTEMGGYKNQPKNNPDGRGMINPFDSFADRTGLLPSPEGDEDPEEEALMAASPLYNQKFVDIRDVMAQLRDEQPEGWEQQVAEMQDYLDNVQKRFFPQEEPIDMEVLAQKVADGERLTPLEHRAYIEHILQANELTSAGKTLLTAATPLSDTEYVNRKLQLGGVPEEETLSSAQEKKERRKLANRERKIEARMAQGMSREEAERSLDYNSTALKDNLALQRDLAFDNDLFNRRYASPLLKAQAYEEHIESILETKPFGWEQRIITLRKQQAELLAPVAPVVAVEPPPPPPVLDFSTEDLELPERFIIKDLEGFKFEPDTKFDGLRLPYESCLFVLGEEPLRAVVLATQEDEDVISLKLLSEQKAELPWHSMATLYVRLNGSRARLKWANTKRTLDKRLGMVSSVLAFLAGEQIGDVEIETVINAPMGREIPPPKPGYSYSVVSIVHEQRKAKRRDWQGGTHASPREHKRKGHWWPGKKGLIWRPATIVNKGVLGRVEKEYHVTKLEGGHDA
jgi:hypothetical protein